MLNNVIKTKSSEEFIWATVAGCAPTRSEESFEFLVEYFHGRYNNRNWICKLKPGLLLSLMDITPSNNIKNTITTKDEYLKFVFFSSGSGNVDYNLIDTRLRRDFSDEMVNHCYTSFSPEIDGVVYVNSGHRLHQLSIHIKPSVLLNYFHGQLDTGPFAFRNILHGEDRKSFFHTTQITGTMNSVISQILNCNYSGMLRQLYLESKAMELIILKLDQMSQSQSPTKELPKLTADGIDRIRHATDILKSNLEKPPSLFELAKAVGTSHTRLNLDFKRIYGTTAFGYLRRIRLEKARDLLAENRLNVSETAFEVGYNSIPSFSKAFSDHFGAPPKTYMKKSD